jgi:hypothetical protein
MSIRGITLRSFGGWGVSRKKGWLGTHTFQVRATDAAGNTDPTPATQSWKVKKKKKK